jgi:hypothetical protein
VENLGGGAWGGAVSAMAPRIRVLGLSGGSGRAGRRRGWGRQVVVRCPASPELRAEPEGRRRPEEEVEAEEGGGKRGLHEVEERGRDEGDGVAR